MRIIYKKRQLEVILLLVIAAFISNLINDFDLLVDNMYPVYNQMFFFIIGYVSLAKLLDIRKKWNTGMVIGQIVIFSLCGLLYYSRTIVDYGAFGICLYSTISTILFLQYKRDKEEIK